MSIERTGLVKYDAMQRAIIAAASVDEVKEIRDKAQALQKYAQQARNFDAERRAAQIRIRAELKTGELLKKAEKAKGGGDIRKSKEHRSQRESGAKTLEQLGITETQSSRWQTLAENPKAVEKYLREAQDVPTTTAALAAVKPMAQSPPPVVHDDVLWIWGRLGDLLARDIDCAKIARLADDRFKEELRSRLSAVIPLLKNLRGELA
jgi:hypothetical protein